MTVFKQLLNDYKQCLLRGDHSDGAAAYLALVDEYEQAARRTPAVPQGWKLVPIEATQEMVDAWSSATELPEGVAEQADDVVNAYAARRDWKAMLAASPETKACYAATLAAQSKQDK